MKREEVIEKNLTQSGLFMQYVLEHPEILEKIPDDATVISIPEDDLGLANTNLECGKKLEAEGKKVVYFKVRAVPQKRTVLVPQVELAEV